VGQLVIGSAQWGTLYGITNTHGRVDDVELVAMVAQAEGSGVTSMDTALAYGDAQVRLAPYSDRFWISTKVSGAGDVAEQVGVCLEQLQVTSLDAVMLHDWDALDDSTRGAAVGVLGEMASDGVIARVGVSVYGESGVEGAVEVFAAAGVDLGIVQVPANAIDQRLDGCAALIALASPGCIVQVRSVFLQGLLTGVGTGALGSHPDVIAFHSWASSERGGAVGAAISHVKALPWVSQVVVGAASVDDWAQVCAAWRDVAPQRAPEHLASMDEVLLDPRRW
jgi:aryl-alcohol dehydrogenase-like predicted oxidoreductase